MLRILKFEYCSIVIIILIVITATTEIPTSTSISVVQGNKNLTTVSTTTAPHRSNTTYQSPSILDQIFELFDLLPQLKFDVETDEHNDTILNLKLVLNNGAEEDDSDDDEYDDDEDDDETNNDSTDGSRAHRQGRDKKNKKHKKDKKKKGGMSKYMSLFAIPMMIHSAMMPMMLSSLKMMLVKSILLGKLALILIFINSLRKSQTMEEKIAVEHYGYKHGSSEEIGAWVNS